MYLIRPNLLNLYSQEASPFQMVSFHDLDLWYIANPKLLPLYMEQDHLNFNYKSNK